MNILLVRLSAIGDCCLVLPVVRSVLEANENCHVHWLIGQGAYQLLKDCTHPRLHFTVIDKPKSIKDYRAIKKQFSEHQFDAVLAMQASSRANLIYPLIKAKRKIGFDKTRARELQWLFTHERIDFKAEHLHDSFMRFAHQLGIDGKQNNEASDWEIAIPLDWSQLKLKFQLPERFVVINPAASKLERSWRSKHYAEVIDIIKNRFGIEVVLTGGHAKFEMELTDRILQQVTAQPINVVGRTSLQELALILKQAELCIAPDTGPVHIANAMGTPVLGLYAVASSKLSGPYHSQSLTIDKFEQAVEEILKQDPATVAWKTRVHSRQAMDLISVQNVVEKLDSFFAKENN